MVVVEGENNDQHVILFLSCLSISTAGTLIKIRVDSDWLINLTTSVVASITLRDLYL